MSHPTTRQAATWLHCSALCRMLLPVCWIICTTVSAKLGRHCREMHCHDCNLPGFGIQKNFLLYLVFYFENLSYIFSKGCRIKNESNWQVFLFDNTFWNGNLSQDFIPAFVDGFNKSANLNQNELGSNSKLQVRYFALIAEALIPNSFSQQAATG